MSSSAAGRARTVVPTWRPRWRDRGEVGEGSARGRRHGDWSGGRRGRGRHERFERPNFFVGFRIVDPTIVDRIQSVQQRITEQLPATERCMIDPRTLHVTLCLMRLQDDAAIQQATEILHRQVEAVALPAFSQEPPCFDFRGLDFFGRNNVLFTPLDVSTPHADSLAELAESLHNAFDAAGFATEPFRKPFTPHLTIWKTSKDRDFVYQLNRERRDDDSIQDALARFLRESEPHSCSALMGTERPHSVELLSMGTKEPDGYYTAHASVSLTSVTVENDTTWST